MLRHRTDGEGKQNGQGQDSSHIAFLLHFRLIGGGGYSSDLEMRQARFNFYLPAPRLFIIIFRANHRKTALLIGKKYHFFLSFPYSF